MFPYLFVSRLVEGEEEGGHSNHRLHDNDDNDDDDDDQASESNSFAPSVNKQDSLVDASVTASPRHEADERGLCEEEAEDDENGGHVGNSVELENASTGIGVSGDGTSSHDQHEEGNGDLKTIASSDEAIPDSHPLPVTHVDTIDSVGKVFVLGDVEDQDLKKKEVDGKDSPESHLQIVPPITDNNETLTVNEEGDEADANAETTAEATTISIGTDASRYTVDDEERGGRNDTRPTSAHYQSELMQKLTADEEEEEEEEELTVYGEHRDDGIEPAASAAAEIAAETAYSGEMPSSRPIAKFEVENSNVQSPHAPQSSVLLPAEAGLGQAWEEMFKGLVYCDGIDSLGRPVVVLDADAVPRNMKSSALVYVKARLEAVVAQGHYVLVVTATEARLPTLWIMGAYQSLPRPFRKNVQYVILVKPTGFLRAVVKFMRAFISSKAHRKIKLLNELDEVSEATNAEVTLDHLGREFKRKMSAVAVGAP